jgi:hypothetical protein
VRGSLAMIAYPTHTASARSGSRRARLERRAASRLTAHSARRAAAPTSTIRPVAIALSSCTHSALHGAASGCSSAASASVTVATSPARGDPMAGLAAHFGERRVAVLAERCEVTVASRLAPRRFTSAAHRPRARLRRLRSPHARLRRSIRGRCCRGRCLYAALERRVDDLLDRGLQFLLRDPLRRRRRGWRRRCL